MIVLIAPLVN